MQTRAQMKAKAAAAKFNTYESACGRTFGIYNKTADRDEYVEESGQHASESIDAMLEAIAQAKQYGASESDLAPLWSRFQAVQQKTQSL